MEWNETLAEPAEQVDTLVHAEWIVPVEPAGEVLRDHALAVRGGRIVALLPSEQADRRYRAAEVLRRPGHLLLPGLVNTHTHAAMTLFRGLADDLPLMTWLERHIWPAEQRWVGREFVRDGTRLACAEMIRGGTTCFQDMYFFPDEAAAVAAECGLRACAGLIVLEFPTAWAAGRDEYFARAAEVHDRFRGHERVHTAFAPHAPYTVSDAAFERIAMLAEELDLPVHTHLHETSAEVERARAETGERPLARLNRLGLLSPRLMAVHMTQLEEEEIDLVAGTGVHVLHAPESNLKLASGFCPVHRLRGRGVNVALGTDGSASNNDLDLMGEMRTAALLAKAVAGDSAALPAHDALAMATLNGARALGLEALTGSLVPGKQADFITVDLDQLATQPVYDPVSQLVYAATRQDVRDVRVGGQALLEQGAFCRLDPREVLTTARRWRERIAAAAG